MTAEESNLIDAERMNHSHCSAFCRPSGQCQITESGVCDAKRMTTEEQNLTEAQRILDGTKCTSCGEYGTATINYEPGCLWVECSRCGRVVSLPDFEPKTALQKWAQTD